MVMTLERGRHRERLQMLKSFMIAGLVQLTAITMNNMRMDIRLHAWPPKHTPDAIGRLIVTSIASVRGIMGIT
jgi:hypothetical protein